VAEHTAKSQQRQKQQYDRGTKQRCFEVGDQVLVLLPSTVNRLKLQWTGPYKIIRKVGTVDYEVGTPGQRREKKIYHVNFLKKWHVLPSVQAALLVEDVGDEMEEEQTEIATWDGPSDEHFYPLELKGAQELNLEIMGPQRGQLYEIL